MRETFPGAEIEVDRPLQNDGEWWIDLFADAFDTTVSWVSGRGFGIYLVDGGFGGRPDELYADPNVALIRIQQIAAARTAGENVVPMSVGQVRRILGHTQSELATALSTGQANISRIEGRANPTLGSLRALVEAMGGALEVRAHFPSLDVPIAIPDRDYDI